MSMFRRPTDDSSDSDTSSEESEAGELDHSHAGTDHSNAGTEEIIGTDLTTAETLSSGESISIDRSHDETTIGDVDHVRNMMLASLLEDYYRTRAVEELNSANPGVHFDRQSPEAQLLARNMFGNASQALLSNGLLTATVLSNEMQNMRGQYLAGFNTFGPQNIRASDPATLSTVQNVSSSEDQLALVRVERPNRPPIMHAMSHPVHNLAARVDRLSVVSHPATDLQISSLQTSRSHYKSSFQEMRLLGRGGFGRVYQTYNVFDKKEYAVKKIPLSVKLSQQYKEKGHTELSSVLREVQALAQLDHCNVVRYHATWIEDPVAPFRPPDPPSFRTPFNRQKLIADRPTFPLGSEVRRQSQARLLSSASDGIKFEADSTGDALSQAGCLEWSHHSQFRQRESSILDSDIFTDGMAHNVRSDKTADDPSCYVLHVQMSMYPQTLAQYLSATISTSRRSSITTNRRHCFHLVPALRILLGILCGLQYIHARGLVHRDIKPSNIFLSSYEQASSLESPDGYHDVGSCPSCPPQLPHFVNPRIGDFGLVADLAGSAASPNGSGSSSNAAVGTEYYRPPVDVGKKMKQAIDERLDVYALGVVFVEMLWPCGTSMERIHLLKDVQKGMVSPEIIATIDAQSRQPGIGNMVGDCIRGMTDNNHSERWTCSKVKEHLEDLLVKCQTSSQGTT